MKRSAVDAIVQPITSALGSDKTRISLSLAITLAFSLPMPTALIRVGTPELYYIKHHMREVNHFISEFNERFLVEVNETALAVKKLWCGRYQMMYCRDPEILMAIARGHCPIYAMLSGYAFDKDVIDNVIASGIGNLDRVERVFRRSTSNTSDV